MDLSKTWKSVAISGAALATFQGVALADEHDAIGDLINAAQNGNGYTDVVHEAIQNPLLDNIDLHYGAEPDIIGQIQAAAEADMPMPPMSNGKFFTFGKIVPSISPQVNADYQANYPEDVGMTAEEPYTVAAEHVQALKDVNAEYFKNFIYITDQEAEHKDDVWKPAEVLDDVHPDRAKLRYGECVQYGLGLQQELNTMGVDISATSLVIVDPNNGGDELHALLMVRTDDGDLLLNNDGTSKFWNETNYTFIQAQGLTDKSVWQEIMPTPFGVEATMADLPEYADVELPRPRPTNVPGGPGF